MGWNLGLTGSRSTYNGYLWPCSIQGHFEVIPCTFDFSQFGPNYKREKKTFWVAVTAKRWETDMRWLVYINRKPYMDINRKPFMGSPMTSHFTLGNLERSKSRSLRFKNSVSCEGAELGHMLPLNINRKAYMGSPLVWLDLTWVTLKGQC